jgi:polysaccharide pyruvyl transferase WcaK-like protein
MKSIFFKDSNVLKSKTNGDRPLRVGLMAPYAGKNLGCMAIHDAVIRNINSLYPNATIRSFNLNPEYTKMIHKIESFPITGFNLPYYSGSFFHEYSLQDKNVIAVKPSVFAMTMNKIKQILKIYPKTFSSVKKCFSLLRIIFSECKHVRKIYKILKEVDLLVVCGGQQVFENWGGKWGHPYSLFKFSIIARLTHSKFEFWSVGVSKLKSKLSRYFLKQALRNASYRSFRDVESLANLRKQNMTIADDDPVIPDLAFSYMPIPKKKDLNEAERNQTIGVSPISYLSENWPQKDQRIYVEYISHMTSFVNRLILDGYSILLFSTDTPDRIAIKDITDQLIKDHGEMPKQILIPSISTVDDLLENLVDIDYVVASRYHGILLSHLIAKPVLAISYEQKVNSHMHLMGQEEYCLDINNISFESLIQSFLMLKANREKIKNLLDTLVNEKRTRLEGFYNSMLSEKNC